MKIQTWPWDFPHPDDPQKRYFFVTQGNAIAAQRERVFQYEEVREIVPEDEEGQRLVRSSAVYEIRVRTANGRYIPQPTEA